MMGKLKILYKGEWKEYLINTEVKDHVMMASIERILKHFPKDAPIEFKENIYK
tara:strand:- start:2208 stop:2366 length:159 start_codon:yes stop_codon:yes gene_type:complete